MGEWDRALPFEEHLRIRQVDPDASTPVGAPGRTWTEREERLRWDASARMRVQRQLVDCEILDLAVGGAFVESPLPLTSDELIELELPLPGGAEWVQARVVWTRRGMADPDGLGLALIGVSAELEERICALLDELEAQST